MKKNAALWTCACVCVCVSGRDGEDRSESAARGIKRGSLLCQTGVGTFTLPSLSLPVASFELKQDQLP